MIFEGFDGRAAGLWGTQPLRLRHTLSGLDLFSDGSLARLVEQLPGTHLQINTAGSVGANTWSACDRGGRTGAEVLEAVRGGRLWINMMGLEEVDRRFADLVARIYAEIEEGVPGLRTSRHRIGVLVSSPGARVHYHTDVPCQTLWQLRGRKRIWVYPPTEPFLRGPEIEDVVRRVSEEGISYEPWFDEYARVHDLEAGDMLHWPLNAPHRIVNDDVVNVSLTTEHWTAPSRRAYLVHFGNGVLRSDLGWRPRSRSTAGPGLLAKAGLATAYRLSGLRHRRTAVRTATHVVDPLAGGGARRLVDAPRPVV
ncbi:cupin-like domain-containing protein [Pseudonocardia sp. ICBG1293]|uniref:cupin-like domain-containing protein n=1 Tax=Pseudonocardia sp. ICBG1293 TaxID=2844382 RepID=UPI001CCE76C1|nr:cupin-like domain-containing protein [Pseudonocardia sp. ICBG1293]